eukprot:2851545-Pyramimonas_sp.AAC.1
MQLAVRHAARSRPYRAILAPKKDMHQDFRRYGLEHPRLGRWLGVIGASRRGIKTVNFAFLTWGLNVNFNMQR